MNIEHRVNNTELIKWNNMRKSSCDAKDLFKMYSGRQAWCLLGKWSCVPK